MIFLDSKLKTLSLLSLFLPVGRASSTNSLISFLIFFFLVLELRRDCPGRRPVLPDVNLLELNRDRQAEHVVTPV